MACQTFDHLADLETSIPKDIKVSLYCIAGYVMEKDSPCEEEIFNDTTFYYQEYGDFFERNRT